MFNSLYANDIYAKCIDKLLSTNNINLAEKILKHFAFKLPEMISKQVQIH